MTAAPEGALVRIRAGGAFLEGNLAMPSSPKGATGIVMFAHGSGSSRHSPRNRAVARLLREGGLATFLVDLLTLDEASVEDDRTAHVSSGGPFGPPSPLRFDVDLLAERLVDATDWLGHAEETRNLPVAFFGASTGGGAALVAAARRPDAVRAVVSRGGRPDLAGAALSRVRSPTLLVVGGADPVVLEMNREAYERLRCEKKLVVIPGATHLFEEPGALEEVARLAREWCRTHFAPPSEHAPALPRPDAPG